MIAAPTSRQNYRAFRDSYRKQRLDHTAHRQHLISERHAGYVRDYLRWLNPHRSAIIVLFALTLITTGFQMAAPLFMRYMVDDVLLNDSLALGARVTMLNVVGAAFLAVITLSAGIGVISNYRQRLLNVRVMLSLRRFLFERLLRLPLQTLSDMKTGGILSRLTGDIDSTTRFLQMAVISPATSVVRLLVGGGIVVALNWQLALVALAVIPGAMLISFAMSRRVRPVHRMILQDIARIDGHVGEVFSGVRVVRAFGREGSERRNYIRGRHAVLRKELFAYRRELLVMTSWGFLITAISGAIVWYGGHLYMDGRASVGDIMALQSYSLLLMNPVHELVNSFSELQRSLAAMERVFDVFRMSDEMPDKPDAINAPTNVDEISFNGVEFEYLKGHPVIKDLNVVVPGGTVVALVGRSGAGKTTVTDLLARFHDPTHGSIRLNGMDIRQFRLRTYRALLAIVQQDVFLFDGSAHDNIAYGNRAATRAEVEDAARRANAHEFISKLPEGYDTFIGERGVKLSGGQQQRLAIARAFLKAPQILILDEATSNLDTESEQLIQAAMTTLLSGRTTFVIAHRLSTVRRADLILLLEDGCVVERGTHEELMACRGKYFEMVDRQMRPDDDELLRSQICFGVPCPGPLDNPGTLGFTSPLRECGPQRPAE